MESATAATHRYTGILLAAGEGMRYRAAVPAAPGHEMHKLLAKLPDGRHVVQASAQTLLTVVPDTIAIVAGHPDALSAILSDAGCQIVDVPDSPRGMGISLAAAARHLIQRPNVQPDTANTEPQPTACVVALADMPWLRADTLKRLLAHAAPDRIVVPVYQGQRGHPVIFGTQFLPELAELGGDTGARALLVRHGALEIECDDVGVLRDVDVPADLLNPA
ncbi:MobA-like NTP transferase domain-containing protein [Bordetella tumbae]|uniref:nucleotidyltransferase family protein n=1 Tax=Bordetella tumbae TaxID=1649139 RepID=UPI0039F0607B